MVAIGDRPRDATGLHRDDDVVDRLLHRQPRLAPAGDHIAVDDHEVRLLLVEHLLHQLDGAAVGELVVLRVVELHHLEGAVGAEPQVPPLSGAGRGGNRRRCGGRGAEGERGAERTECSRGEDGSPADRQSVGHAWSPSSSGGHRRGETRDARCRRGDRQVNGGNDAQRGSAASIAWTISGASGFCFGRKRSTSPSGSTRNFSKFHSTRPALPPASGVSLSAL